jgi:transcriptional regulator with PAS, ATPase and Fis domain
MKLPIPPADCPNASGDGVIVFAEDGKILYSNSRFHALTGRRKSLAEGFVSKDLRDLASRTAQSGKSFAKDRARCGKSGEEIDVDVYIVDNYETPSRATILVIKDPNRPRPAGSHAAKTQAASSWGTRPDRSERLGLEFSELKGEDTGFLTTLLQAQKAAKSSLPVLIIGESGTGKEGLARAIHQTSDRKDMPFVDINCAAIPDTLIESELFGYEGGAFTGARREGRGGLFDQAHGGTIFLDEIGDASLQTQAKILRVLQEGRFKRIGGTRNVAVDVRPISATNRSLTELVSQGGFRQDLVYRLNTITISLPPLRERRGDIRLLADHFLQDHGAMHGKTFGFSSKAMKLMEEYKWPGNVRELKGVVDYAATMASTSILTADSLPSFLKEAHGNIPEEPESDRHPSEPGAGQGLLNGALREVERTLIKQTLAESRTRSEAIKTLGISRRAFYLKLKQYGLA